MIERKGGYIMNVDIKNGIPFISTPTAPEPWQKRPHLGTANWKRHKARAANRRKAANIAARKTRKAQRRAG